MLWRNAVRGEARRRAAQPFPSLAFPGAALALSMIEAAGAGRLSFLFRCVPPFVPSSVTFTAGFSFSRRAVRAI